LFVPGSAVLATWIFQTATGGGSALTTFLPLVFAFLLFYLLLIRPQQTRQKKWNAMLETLKSGDRVTTSGGMRGVITRVKDDAFVLRVAPDNLQIEVVKSAVVSVTTDDEKAKS
jgi:preprotein translocase subunit YajC